MNESDLNRLLQQALAPKEFPSDQLNQTIRNRVQEEQTMKRFSKKRPLAAALVAALVLALSITGFASWRFLSAGEAAEHSGMSNLARAFKSGDAVSVNQTVASGGYTFSFLGIASGENLSGFQSDSQVNPKRTYAVLAIAKTDGTAMAADGSESFFVSPLIKGQKPWQVNITTMNGGYTEFAEGGVLYRLIECDDIEMFADRGLYLCVSTSDFYDKNAFTYDEETGRSRPTRITAALAPCSTCRSTQRRRTAPRRTPTWKPFWNRGRTIPRNPAGQPVRTIGRMRSPTGRSYRAQNRRSPTTRTGWPTIPSAATARPLTRSSCWGTVRSAPPAAPP